MTFDFRFVAAQREGRAGSVSPHFDAKSVSKFFSVCKESFSLHEIAPGVIASTSLGEVCGSAARHFSVFAILFNGLTLCGR